MKQEKEVATPLEFLVVMSEEEEVKTMLSKYSIIVLSIKEFTAELETFGNISAYIGWRDEGIQLVFNKTDIEATCEQLLRLGLDILDINLLSSPMTTKTVEELLQKKRDLVDKDREKEKVTSEAEKTKAKKIYMDPRLTGAKEAISWIIDRIPVITQRMDRSIGFGEFKKLKELQEKLKKLKMGNNFEKIRDGGGELLRLVQDLDERYFIGIQDQAKPVIPGSVVTDVDTQREVLRLSYAIQSKKIGAAQSPQNKSYGLFGQGLVLRRFLQKDFGHVFTRSTQLLFGLYTIIEYIYLLVLVMGAMLIVINPLFSLFPNMDGIYLAMIKRGIAGGLFFVLKHWRRQNMAQLALVYLGTIVLYFIVKSLIMTNFAL